LALGRAWTIRTVAAMFGRQGSYYLGDLGPIPLFVHPSAIVLVLMVVMYNFNAGVVPILVMLTVLIASIILHELGHGLMARALGAFGITITLGAFGGLCESSRDSMNRPGREIAILVAGPAVSFALWAGCHFLLAWAVVNHPEWVTERVRQGLNGEGHYQLSLIGRFLMIGEWLNLGLGIFNSLPIYPLDGGQTVFNLIRLFPRSFNLARHLTLAISIFTGLGAVTAYVIIFKDLPSTWTLVLIGYLLYTSFRYLR
jgi:Zn-dependent protease